MTVVSNEFSGPVLPGELYDLLGITVAPVGVASHIEEIQVILDSIEEDYTEDVRPKPSMQEITKELALVLPHYLSLLKASLKDHGAEMYLDLKEACEFLGTPDATPHGLYPKLVLEDDTCGYALMQIAGYKALLGDEHVKLWYQALIGLLGNFDKREQTYILQ